MDNLIRKPFLYLCNPNLAKEKCSQTGCYLNGGPCELTTNPEYAYTVNVISDTNIPLCIMSLENINDGIKNGTLMEDIDRAVAVAKTIKKIGKEQK